MSVGRERGVVRITGPGEYMVFGTGFWVAGNRILTLDVVASLAGTIYITGLHDPPSGRAAARVVDQWDVPGLLVKVALLEVPDAMPGQESVELYQNEYGGSLVESIGFPETYNYLVASGHAVPASNGLFAIEWRSPLGHRRGYAGAPAFMPGSDSVIGMVVPQEVVSGDKSFLIPAHTLREALSALGVNRTTTIPETSRRQNAGKWADLVAVDLAARDAAYQRFPSFSEWQFLTVDTARWDRYSSRLLGEPAANKEGTSPTPRALEIIRRVGTAHEAGLNRALEIV